MPKSHHKIKSKTEIKVEQISKEIFKNKVYDLHCDLCRLSPLSGMASCFRLTHSRAVPLSSLTTALQDGGGNAMWQTVILSQSTSSTGLSESEINVGGE